MTWRDVVDSGDRRTLVGDATLATTAGSVNRRRTGPRGLSIAGTFIFSLTFGTSPYAIAEDTTPYLFVDGSTHAGIKSTPVAVRSIRSTADQIKELKEISGLTWEELSSMFGVDRRSVHYWAQGATLSADNAAKLAHAFEQVRRLAAACGNSAESVRSTLLTPAENGLPLLARVALPPGETPPDAKSVRTPAPFRKLDLGTMPLDLPPLTLEDRVSSTAERVRDAGGSRRRRIRVPRKRRD